METMFLVFRKEEIVLVQKYPDKVACLKRQDMT